MASWEARIARARSLAAGSELLTFYAGLLEVQRGLVERSLNARAELMGFVERSGPAEMRGWAQAGGEGGEYAEFLKAALLQVERERDGCPAHEGGISVLREAGEGLRRALVCGWCQAEWNVPRVECVHCGEVRFEAVPVFTIEEFAYLRIEACDTCRHYVLSVNLVACAEAVATVDDIAALPAHLWAQEHGYSRVHPNLFGF